MQKNTRQELPAGIKNAGIFLGYT